LRTFLIFSTLVSTSLSALVSIAPVDIGSAPGFSGTLGGEMGSKSGNTNTDGYAFGTRLQYDEGINYLTWGTFTYNYGKSNGMKNEDKLYTHIRAIHSLFDNNWCSEFFLQSEQDKFKSINNRSLAGSGVRWRVFNTDMMGKGYAGVGIFEEKIFYTQSDINPIETNTRLNSYLAYTKNFTEFSKVSYIGYFQPKFGDISDYITSQNVELIIPIYQKLNLLLTALYLYDSAPAIGIKKEDIQYKTSFTWKF
jgi:putative salt-induced outer membrane protein YdiY